MTSTRLCLVGFLVALSSLSASAAPQQADWIAPGAHGKVKFADYPSMATAPAVVSRVLSPLAVEAVRRNLKASGKALQPQMFDLKSEEFVVYVPRNRPASGYGLLVFVPPWPTAEIPPGWTAVLEHYGVIFVSADRSGNDAEVLERRIPLALAGLANIRARFSIDPARTLIGGFSGGSRVALRIALAYPDLFSGVFLNAGSDPIAKNPDHLPAPNLFQMFQTNTRVAFVTGEEDQGSLALDASSQSSMVHWCVSNVSLRGERGLGHEVATAPALEWAFQTLFANGHPDTNALGTCREARRQDVGRSLAEARRAVATGDRSRARRMLLELDRSFGGLAAPQSVSLADQCDCAILKSGAPPSTH